MVNRGLPLVMVDRTLRDSNDLSIFAVLADPTRRSLLELLRRKPLPVGKLASQVAVSRPAVSHHLKILKQAELVRERRDGTRHYFGLNATGFASLREYADSMWQTAIDVFAVYVAEQKKAGAKSSPKGRKRKER